jgi:glycosidase
MALLYAGGMTMLSLVGLSLAVLGSVRLGSENDFSKRRADWRMGAVVYQVFVDRFVPPANASAKLGLYPGGRLHAWTDLPVPSGYDPKVGTYPHVLEFWGGDLAGVRSKLDYVHDLGADVLYLTPIFKSPSNHKYDTENYFEIDPQFGSASDLAGLIGAVHQNGMRIMLDGVFNHIGVTNPVFQEAFHNPSSPHRDWFFFGKEYPLGYRGWAGVKDLPGWKLETAGVRNYLWGSKDSVVQHYLHQGIDGWRLDVGYEIGPVFLDELTRMAHFAKPGSWVVGEVNGYPASWFPSLDGVFNFHMNNLAERLLDGDLEGGTVGRMYERVVEDAGIENLLRSWILTDNHDTPRLATKEPDFARRKILHALQLTLPGAPCLYYGTELGMTGGDDPADRAPMRWDLVNDGNSELAWVKKLLAVRKAFPALRYGDYLGIDTRRLLAFARVTDRIRESAIVVANPTDQEVHELLQLRMGHLMSYGQLEDQMSGQKLTEYTGILDAKLGPHQVMILTPVIDKTRGYSPYNRIP